MKRIVMVFSLVWLLSACGAPKARKQGIDSKTNCPVPAAGLPAPTSPDNSAVFDHFDYRPHNIVADANTIKFQTVTYDFVFCRGDRTWSVQPGTLPQELLPSANAAEQTKELATYKPIAFNGRTYQYRVTLEASSAPEPKETNSAASPSPKSQSSDQSTTRSSPKPGEKSKSTPSPSPNSTENNNSANSSSSTPDDGNKVVFELVPAAGQEPKRHTLYTLKSVKQAGIGNRLGVPRVTATTLYGDRLWWAVASSQGEGANGLTTLVSYEPQTDQLLVIQPRELRDQQITDMAIAGDPNRPTFWLGTMGSGENDPMFPTMGLVAYRPELRNLNAGAVTSYNLSNSSLVGGIPFKLKLEDKTLWVGTGNGVCQLQWQTADNTESWTCWRFAAIAKLPPVQVSLYSSLVADIAPLTLSPTTDQQTVEVLSWMPIEAKLGKGRYEVRNTKGFTVTLNQGARLWSEVLAPNTTIPAHWPAVDWPGIGWHWQGDRFVRGFDEVNRAAFGHGVKGIVADSLKYDNVINWNTIRGDLELISLSKDSTSIKYYSGWVDDALLKPYPTVVPQEQPANPQPNPLDAVANQLQPR